MVKIFISHPWTENAQYERFIETVDEACGKEKWINLSIPRSAAIDVAGEELARQQDEYTRLKEEVRRIRSILPALPDALTRTVMRDGRLVELDTVATATKKLEHILGGLEEHVATRTALGLESLSADSRELDYALITKNVAHRISRAYPALTASIQDKISHAEIVFVLLTSAIRLHEWVAQEIALSAMYGIPRVGVKTTEVHVTTDFRHACTEIVEWSSVQVLSALEKYCPSCGASTCCPRTGRGD